MGSGTRVVRGRRWCCGSGRRGRQPALGQPDVLTQEAQMLTDMWSQLCIQLAVADHAQRRWRSSATPATCRLVTHRFLQTAGAPPSLCTVKLAQSTCHRDMGDLEYAPADRMNDHRGRRTPMGQAIRARHRAEDTMSDKARLAASLTGVREVVGDLPLPRCGVARMDGGAGVRGHGTEFVPDGADFICHCGRSGPRAEAVARHRTGWKSRAARRSGGQDGRSTRRDTTARHPSSER